LKNIFIFWTISRIRAPDLFDHVSQGITGQWDEAEEGIFASLKDLQQPLFLEPSPLLDFTDSPQSPISAGRS
jgi:hypothetical protein